MHAPFQETFGYAGDVHRLMAKLKTASASQADVYAAAYHGAIHPIQGAEEAIFNKWNEAATFMRVLFQSKG